MIRRIQKNNDLLDVIKSCPSGVIDDIYKIEYYIQGYNTVYDAKFTKEEDCLNVVLPSSELGKLENGILMRRAYYKVSDSSYPDGSYDLTFEDNMNVWLGSGESSDKQYVTEKELNETLEDYALKTEVPSLDGYATEEWVNNKGYVTAETLPEGIATESWVQSQGYLTEHQSLDGYATEQWVNDHGYLTEHQSIKTVNNQSLLGEGNIDISGMTPEQETAIEPLTSPDEGVLFTKKFEKYIAQKMTSPIMSSDFLDNMTNIGDEVYTTADITLYRLNPKNLMFETVFTSDGTNFYQPLWSDSQGRIYMGDYGQVDIENKTLINLPLNFNNSSWTTGVINIFNGKYGTYSLHGTAMKFDEETQQFIDFPIYFPEGYGAVDTEFGLYGFWYDNHFIWWNSTDTMFEIKEYEDHLEMVIVSEPYFPLTVNSKLLLPSRMYIVDGELYFIGNFWESSYHLVSGEWVEIPQYTFKVIDGNSLNNLQIVNRPISYGRYILCRQFIPDEYCVMNMSDDTETITGWSPITNLGAVDLKSEQYILGIKRFINVQNNNLGIESVSTINGYTNIVLGKNKTSASSIDLNAESFKFNGNNVVTEDKLYMNTSELPYGGLKSESINGEFGSIGWDSNFRTHTGRWINFSDDKYYEFDGTQFNLLRDTDVVYVNNNNNSRIVVTPNMTFYNGSDQIYIWDDINNNFISVCNNLGDEDWAYWWDGINLRYRESYKLVNTNDSWEWVEDMIPEYYSGMYHYVDSRVIVLDDNSNVQEYNPSDKTYTHIGFYNKWTNLSFVYDNYIIYPFSNVPELEYILLDISKEIPVGETIKNESTDIPATHYMTAMIDYQGHLWSFFDNYNVGYYYGLLYSKPEVPATDGGYVLTGTRNGDSVTYSWETSQGGGSTPDLSSYATKDWVTEQGYLTSHQSLDGYATESWVESKGYITSHQDLSSYALKSEVPSLEGYATQSWATSQFLEESKIWTGTQSAWDALDSSQKASYTIALITE